MRSLLSVLLLLLIVSGCRTYGRYGNEAETLEQIQEVTRLFAEDLERARGDLNTLQQATSANSAIALATEAYAAVVEVQEAMVADHQELAAEAAEHSGNYRLLHRTYAAMISDHNIIKNRYRGVLTDLEHAMRGAPEMPVQMVLESRYQAVPQFYRRIEYANTRRPLLDILSNTRSAPPAADTTAMAPPPAPMVTDTTATQ